MIKEIFLPEIFKGRRIYSQIILGFSIEDDYVNCVKIIAGRNHNIIQKVVKNKINLKDKQNYNFQTSKSIKKIIQNIGKFDQVYVSIPASKVVFKEIEVPFLDIDKIRMILDYEIEPKLPFSINDSVVDFIVTKQSIAQKKSQILAAAIRNIDLENILNIYNQAEIEPTKITIDLFSIYSLYQQTPEYKDIKGPSTIVNLGANTTRIALLQDGHLRLTRVIPQGINSIILNVASETNESLEKIKEKIVTYGLSISAKENENKIIQKHAISFFHDIQFTLNSFTLKLNLDNAISKILFTGNYSNLKNLTSFCKKLLQIPCEIFDCEKIFSNPKFINKNKEKVYNWNQYITSFGCTVPSQETLNFNLRRKNFEPNFTKLLSKQIITAISLVVTIFMVLIIYGIFRIQNLTNKINTIEKEEITKILKIFPKDFRLPKKIAFRPLIAKADKIISEKLEIWGPFENQRIQPLLILQELTNIIDKRRFDVTIKSVSITEEEEKAKIDIEGFFRSKTGNNHFKYFAELIKRFENSKILEFCDVKEEIDSILKGIKFTIKLKFKE